MRMMFEEQRGRAIWVHMYYPIRPLRSVVKESAKSELRSVSTRDLRRGSADAAQNKWKQE